MWRIKRAVLLDLLEAARNAYPNEFFALLGGNKKEKIIDEIIVVPAEYGRTSTLIKTWLVPFDSRIAGSAHSHPGNYNFPSSADISSFAQFGTIHLIMAHPYNLNSTRAFNVKGKQEKVEVVE